MILWLACVHVLSMYLLVQGAQNRLSRFTYNSGSNAATLASVDVLVTSIPKSTSIHSAGWCGFKPSDYTNNAGVSFEFYFLKWMCCFFFILWWCWFVRYAG